MRDGVSELCVGGSLLLFVVGYGKTFIMQYVVVEVLQALLLVSTALSVFVRRGERARNIFGTLALLGALGSFFVVINNVFLMKEGVAHCEECDAATARSIAAGYIFSLSYLVFLITAALSLHGRKRARRAKGKA